jgi:hypothetical protein
MRQGTDAGADLLDAEKTTRRFFGDDDVSLEATRGGVEHGFDLEATLGEWKSLVWLPGLDCTV